MMISITALSIHLHSSLPLALMPHSSRMRRSSVNSSLIDSNAIELKLYSLGSMTMSLGKTIIRAICHEAIMSFSGEFYSNLCLFRCNQCDYQSRTNSEFTELDLSIEGFKTLKECLQAFLKVSCFLLIIFNRNEV